MEAGVTMQTFQEIPNFQKLNYIHPYYTKECSNYPQSEVAFDLGLGLEKNIAIRKAVTIDEMVKVFRVRWEGYKKYYKSEDENLDNYDLLPGTTLLLAEDQHGNAVGTIRIIDRRCGSIELDKFIDLDSFLSEEERVCVEATRFSIPKHPDSKLIKLLLWKSLFIYCQINHINTILMSARPAAARSYRCLFFENVGTSGVYSHSLLGNLKHETYKCNISERKCVMKRENRSLYDFFFGKDHPNINTDYFQVDTQEDESFKSLFHEENNAAFI
jgi:hypothetical protein